MARRSVTRLSSTQCRPRDSLRLAMSKQATDALAASPIRWRRPQLEVWSIVWYYRCERLEISIDFRRRSCGGFQKGQPYARGRRSE